MNITTLNDIANSPFAYLILFMLLLGYVIKSSDDREKKMREQLDKTIPILRQILTRLDIIEEEIKK